MDKLEGLVRRAGELDRLLCEPTVATDPSRYRKLTKERSGLEGLVTSFAEYKKLAKQLEEENKKKKAEEERLRKEKEQVEARQKAERKLREDAEKAQREKEKRLKEANKANPEKAKKQSRPDAKGHSAPDPYAGIIAHFDDHEIDLLNDASDKLYRSSLDEVPGLRELVKSKHAYLDATEVPLWMEFVLHGLAEKSRIGRSTLAGSTRFSDMLGSVFSGSADEEEDDDR